MNQLGSTGINVTPHQIVCWSGNKWSRNR